MTNESKIFDDYLVDCNECQSYWLDQCDGAKVGSQKACTAFKAVRRTDLPEQIENLEKRLVRAETGFLIIGALVVLIEVLEWLL